MQKLKIKKYLTEKENTEICKNLIEEVMQKRQMMLLVSPLCTGKTTLSLDFIPKYLEHYYMGTIKIFVSPRVSLLQELNTKYDIMQVSNGIREQDIIMADTIPIATTNDSLYKVINRCKQYNKKYLLIVDESHEMVSSYSYRKNIISPIRYHEEDKEHCLGLICLTGTPEPLELMEFDKMYSFNVENKFYQTDLTEIRCNFDYENKTLAKAKTILIEKNNSENPIISRNLNKEENKKIKEMLLKMDSSLKIYLWHRETSKEEEEEFKSDKEILLNLFQKKKCDYDIILTTSLIDVGVELYLDYKPIVLDFIGKNANIIDDIQFIGRFRNGTSKYIILGTMDKFKDDIKNQQEIYEDTLKNAKDLQRILNRHQENQEVKTNLLKVVKNIEEETVSYEIDEMLIKAETFRLYSKQFLSTPTKLMNFLKGHSTYNSKSYKINPSFNVIPLESCNKESISEEDKEQRKQDLKVFKDKRKSMIKAFETLEDDCIKDLMLKEEDLKQSKNYKYIMDNCKEEYFNLHDEEFKDYRKYYWDLIKYDSFNKSCSDKEILLNVLNNKFNEIYNYKREIILSSLNYHDGEKPLSKKLHEKIYDILDIFYDLDIVKKKKEENKKLYPITLSEKLENEIINKSKSKRNLKDMKEEDILKLFKLIFNISEYERITSFNVDNEKNKEYIERYLKGEEPTKAKKCKDIYKILDMLEIRNKSFPITYTEEMKNNLSNCELDKLSRKILKLGYKTRISNIKTDKDLILKSLFNNL